MYYIYGRVRVIPTYRVYRLYDNLHTFPTPADALKSEEKLWECLCVCCFEGGELDWLVPLSWTTVVATAGWALSIWLASLISAGKILVVQAG